MNQERVKAIAELLEFAFALPAVADNIGPLRAWTKQLRVDGIDTKSRETLSACFPAFEGLQRRSKSLSDHGMKVDVTSRGTQRVATGRHRRYAGDETLPGGCYYSVCNDSSGNDDGILVWELMTYWDNTSTKFPSILDSTAHIEDAAPYRLRYPHLAEQPFLMLTARDIVSVNSEGIHLGETEQVFVPLVIEEVEINSVLDLRHPLMQDCFSEILGTLEALVGNQGNSLYGNVDVTLKKPPGNFASLLPTLLTPQPGATTFHDAIGAICRSAEVNGLVFPSARRDVHVASTRSGEIESFSGWNFVDYRRAPPMNTKVALENFGRLVQWLTPKNIGIDLEWHDDGNLREWKVSGAEDGERRRYDLEWLIKAGLRSPLSDKSTYFSARERGT